MVYTICMQKLWNQKTRAIASLIIILAVVAGIVYFLKPKAVTEEIQNPDSSYANPEENDSFQDYDDLHIALISPTIGYETSFSPYPKLTWKTETITEKSERVTIDVRYPHFAGGTPVAKLNQYIEKIFIEIITDDRKDLEDMVRNDPQSFSSMLDVASRYRIIGVTNGIMSLELVIVDFTGGGSGNHSVPYTINWDLKSDRLLVPEDIFCNSEYISVLKPLVRAQLIARMACGRTRRFVALGSETGRK